MNAKNQQLYSQYINDHTATYKIDNCPTTNQTSPPPTNHKNCLHDSLYNINTKRESRNFQSNKLKQRDYKNYNITKADNLWQKQQQQRQQQQQQQKHIQNSCTKYEMSNGINKNIASCCSISDRVNCITLKYILESFKAPLSEEHAWAIIYQYINMFRQICDANNYKDYNFNYSEIPEILDDLFLHHDGTVHCSFKDFPTNGNVNKKQEDQQQPQQQKQHNQQQKQLQLQQQQNCIDDHVQLIIASHKKILRNVGILVYTALDYNLHEDEQCQISKELEDLITYMTTNVVEDDCIDEGIDEGCKRWDDEFETNPKSNETKEFDIVLKACLNHIKPAVPEEHYKAVCRALVTETIELGIFLQQVLINKSNDFNTNSDLNNASQQELAKLGFNDWARFWIQVIDELRKGVRLKKANYVRTPIEYELTPYEILMEDIRSKKYQLRKVMINGDIPPRVKKDAHALILEFIRSRPPLKKMSERKLAPPIKRTLSPRELLMDSIRQGYTLKHVKSPPRTSPRLNYPIFLSAAETKTSTKLPLTENVDNESGGYRATCRSRQRLIKVDFSLLQDDETNFDHQNLTSMATSNAASKVQRRTTVALTNKSICAQPKMPPYPIEPHMLSDPMTSKPINSSINEVSNPLILDVAQRRMGDDHGRSPLRRHSIVGCQNNLNEIASTSMSRPQSRQSNANLISANDNDYYGVCQQQQKQQEKSQQNNNTSINDGDYKSHEMPWSKSFMDEKTWNEVADDRLSLTLEEIVHIRSVMTKAELESLPVGVRVKEDVEKRKICFLCLRTRFSLFGPWGVECKICKRTVCTKCHTKMRIPAEHFRNVPLVLISPSLLSTPAGSSSPSPSHHAGYVHSSSSTGNIMDESFSKTLIERLIRSDITEPKSCIGVVHTPPSSPKHQRSNMSTPGIRASYGVTSGQTMEAVQSKTALPLSSLTGITYSSTEDLITNRIYNSYIRQQSNYCKNFQTMSRSMEGPRSLPMQSPASRSHSNNSTLDRKSRFYQKLALSSSSNPLARDQKENLQGEQVPVCKDCHGLVMEISKSAKHKRSPARNQTLKKLTLDLRPVWK